MYRRRMTEQIDVLLPGKFPIPKTQHYYAAGRCAPIARRLARPAPPGISIRPVDRDLLAEDLEGLDDLREEMQSERPSVNEFLEKSFGFRPVLGNESSAGACPSTTAGPL